MFDFMCALSLFHRERGKEIVFRHLSETTAGFAQIKVLNLTTELQIDAFHPVNDALL